MLTAFFLTDLFRGNIRNRSNSEAVPEVDGNRVENVSDPRPRVSWISGWSNPAWGAGLKGNFCVDNDNRRIEISTTPSGSITTLSIPRAGYSGANLAVEVDKAFAAAGYSGWGCSYDAVNGRFTMGGSPAIYFRWKTGTHGSDGDGTSLANEMGYDNTSDSGPTLSTVSDYQRWNTHTWVLFDLESALSIWAFLADVRTTDPAGTVDDSTMKMFSGNTNNDGFDLSWWQDNANYELEFSPAPEHPENTIRLAHNGGIFAASRYWLFSWRHQDSLKRHDVGLLKAFRRTWSGTRTVTTLRGHGLENPQRGLGVNNYYPVEQILRWRVPLGFDSWGAADYRDVIHATVRHGKADGLLWALRWDEIADGTVAAEDEADKGFLVWSALQTYKRDTYVGEGADYISGSLLLEQVR